GIRSRGHAPRNPRRAQAGMQAAHEPPGPREFRGEVLPLRHGGRERITQIDPFTLPAVPDTVPLTGVPAVVPGEAPYQLPANLGTRHRGRRLDRLLDIVDAIDAMAQHPARVEGREDPLASELPEPHVDLEEPVAQLEERGEFVPAKAML